MDNHTIAVVQQEDIDAASRQTDKELVLRGRFSRDIDFTPLTRVQDWETLRLINIGEHHLDLRPLGHTSVKRFTVSSIGDVVLPDELDTEEATLCLPDTDSLGHYIESVAGWSDIRWLFVKGVLLYDMDADIDLENSNVTAVDLSPLSETKTLEGVAVTDFPALKYVKLPGSESIKEIRVNKTGLGEINLNPLQQDCIEVVDLAKNQIEWIDLWVFKRGAYSLKKLDLSMNELREIDLRPLSSCRNLQILILSWNHIRTIDLSPLKGNEELRTLDLENNKLTELDLSPLMDCIGLADGWTDLGGNEISRLDVEAYIIMRNKALKVLKRDLDMVFHTDEGTRLEARLDLLFKPGIYTVDVLPRPVHWYKDKNGEREELGVMDDTEVRKCFRETYFPTKRDSQS